MDAADFDFGLHIETARLQQFLAQLLHSQEQINKRQEELAATVGDLLKRFEDREQGAEEQNQAMQRLQESILRLSERHNALDRLRIGEKLERYDSHHDDINALQTQLAGLDSIVGPQR